MRINKTVANYWYKYYAVNGWCILCRNIGFVSVTGAKTSRVPCICPNGQSVRAHSITYEG